MDCLSIGIFCRPVTRSVARGSQRLWAVLQPFQHAIEPESRAVTHRQRRQTLLTKPVQCGNRAIESLSDPFAVQVVASVRWLACPASAASAALPSAPSVVRPLRSAARHDPNHATRRIRDEATHATRVGTAFSSVGASPAGSAGTGCRAINGASLGAARFLKVARSEA